MTYLIRFALLAADRAYIRPYFHLGHCVDFLAAMANRGSGVNLALVLAFLLDAEEVFQEPRQAPLVRPFLRMSAGLIIFFASKFDWGMEWMGSLNVMLNFLNFPRLYTFCYTYLNIVDPVTLFGELAVGGVVFFILFIFLFGSTFTRFIFRFDFCSASLRFVFVSRDRPQSYVLHCT